MNPYLLAALISSGVAFYGGWTANNWKRDSEELAAAGLRARDATKQIKDMDKASMAHVTALATVNNQLGYAREKIASLSGRECFDAGTAGVLNDIGDQPVPAAAGELEGATPATASGGGLRYSTDRDAAGAIAICRARYAEVSSQVNQILNIEESRHK
jgi:hypothetical protein